MTLPPGRKPLTDLECIALLHQKSSSISKKDWYIVIGRGSSTVRLWDTVPELKQLEPGDEVYKIGEKIASIGDYYDI